MFGNRFYRRALFYKDIQTRQVVVPIYLSFKPWRSIKNLYYGEETPILVVQISYIRVEQTSFGRSHFSTLKLTHSTA